MVKINLLPREDIESRAIGKFLKWTLSYGRYIIISVELVVFLVFFSRFIYDQQLADINDRIEQKQAIVVSASDFEDRIRDVQNRIKQVKELDEGRDVYIKVLQRLEEITPQDMIFTAITFNKGIVTLEGETLTNESFAKLLTTLKADTALFSEITLNSVGKSEPEDAEENDAEIVYRILFSIDAQVEGYVSHEITPTPRAANPDENPEDL